MTRDYANRKEQIENGFAPTLFRDLGAIGIRLTPRARGLIKAALKSAAMVGGCEERSRALEMLREGGRAMLTEGGHAESHWAEIFDAICRDTVLSVLGYEP